MTRRALSTTAVALGTAALVGLATAGAPAAAGAPSSGPKSGTATGSPQQGVPVPAGFASWQELLAVQERLVEAADRLTAAGGSGLAGVVLAPEERRLTLFHRGNTPARLDSTLADVRRKVTVSVVPARHSGTQLAREARRLVTQGRSAISSVAPLPDGSGLQVSVAGSASTGTRRLLTESSVPVTLRAGVSPRTATRWNDSAPWYGGAAWRNATRGGGCSTGFAVWHQGRTKMLSAGHCASLNDRATDPTGEHMGYVTQDSNAYDVQLIDARSAGRVFNNTASLSEFTNPVIGTTGSYVGMYLCTSGAYSGTRCGIRVTATGVTINVGYLIHNTVQAEKVDRTSALGQGDSGGAVEVVASDTTKVYAAGVNTAIDTGTAVACTGYVTSGRTCAWRMYYAPWGSAAGLFGATIVTG